MRNQRGLVPVLVLLLITALIIGGYFVYQKQQKTKPTSVTVSGYSPTATTQPQSQLDTLSAEWLDYFTSKILPKYPEVQANIDPKDVKRVFPISLKTEDSYTEKNNWLAEVKKLKSTTYYFISPKVQKELSNAVTAYSDVTIDCAIENIYTAGNEKGLGRVLQDKEGYLILDGNCNGYGGGRFVSVYKLSNAEKVTLLGSEGVSSSGNATGRVRGIYGISNPILVVDYGSFESAATKVEEISSTAYFDLQSGQLKQIVKFK